jgi:hypothetical protein
LRAAPSLTRAQRVKRPARIPFSPSFETAAYKSAIADLDT